ncbi:MAG: hypothetical protein CM1200mP16_06790 [Nitrospina sp.]|nr:MAG: hypothetical protein CM1200mP16_06790 [Nitrospina sp.]
MKLTLRVIAWLVLSCTHVLGSIEICGQPMLLTLLVL